MSIALDIIDVAPSSSGGFMHGAAMSFGLIFESSPGEERAPPVASSSLSSSSIGKNSGVSSSEEGDEENDEAQSSYKGPLDMMEALEEVLPIRRGISRFYNYKSKSFTSLAEAATSSSIKEIAKQDNAYTRKRRNLLASNIICRGGISKSSKRTITGSQSTLALALAMCSPEASPSTSDDSSSCSLTHSSFDKLGDHAAWRSLSLADLQECATSAAVNTTSRFFPSKSKLQQ
ncbi:protein OXIDATIVE STRESS 3 LIKE 2 [Argentina anserina]|uniref:protein OXIDATIVE STRESS 3 LIKE 2 n=1 Tax=Argentina anserina TaxID=57926 RepID=UPI0021764C99|nr:protein OXIDATIVE STRESS 3 LIKE 2 [Potentilla anserina]